MKRELKLNIVQDVETKKYFINVVKQTHRGMGFTPNRVYFEYNGFYLRSCGSPAIEGGYMGFFVRGSIEVNDSATSTTWDTEYITRLMEAVDAYNAIEEDDCVQEESYHVSNIKHNLDAFVLHKERVLDGFRQSLKPIKIDNDILNWKTELMFSLAEFPLGVDFCTFCSGNTHGGSLWCNDCEYGNIKGKCNDGNSGYKRIIKALVALKNEIRNHPIDNVKTELFTAQFGE